MATTKTVVYECRKCGTEVTVNSSGLKSVEPIYCCGLPLYKTNKALGKKVPIKKQKTGSERKSERKEPRKISGKAAIKPVKKN